MAASQPRWNSGVSPVSDIRRPPIARRCVISDAGRGTSTIIESRVRSVF
jgi:hypothetical protein